MPKDNSADKSAAELFDSLLHSRSQKSRKPPSKRSRAKAAAEPASDYPPAEGWDNIPDDTYG